MIKIGKKFVRWKQFICICYDCSSVKVLLCAIMYGNIKSTCGLKWIEDQEEQKKKRSRPQKLADKE